MVDDDDGKVSAEVEGKVSTTVKFALSVSSPPGPNKAASPQINSPVRRTAAQAIAIFPKFPRNFSAIPDFRDAGLVCAGLAETGLDETLLTGDSEIVDAGEASDAAIGEATDDDTGEGAEG